MNVEQRIIKIVASQLKVDETSFKLDTNIVEDLGGDSLDAAEIIFDIEDEFGIELSKEEYTGMRTIQNLVEMVSKKI
jgi:acyl carrier protein